MGLFGNVDSAALLEEEEKRKKEKEAEQPTLEETLTPTEQVAIGAPSTDVEEVDTPDLESNVTAATEPDEIDAPQGTDLESNISSLIENGARGSEVEDKISSGTNYKDAMQDLDKELAAEEARLSKGLKTKRDSARAVDLITSGIQALAAYTAASQGIKTKLSGPLDTGSKQRLQEMLEEVNNNRRVLRSRIQSKKTLINKLYSNEVREGAKEERDTTRESNNKERIDFYNEQVSNDNTINAENYQAAIRKTEQVFLERWKKAPDEVKRARIQEWSPHLTPDQVDKIVTDVKDPDGVLFWESLPDYSDVKAGIAQEALRIVRKPKPRGLKEGGSVSVDQVQPTVAAPAPAAPSTEVSDEDRAAMEAFLLDAATSNDPVVTAKAQRIRKILGK